MPNELEDNLPGAYDVLGQFPHCDAKVLHRPGACSYCDLHPDWQALRILWGINFSGESDPKKMRCPSEEARPAHVIHRWPGNQATETPVRTTPRSIYEMISDDDTL